MRQLRVRQNGDASQVVIIKLDHRHIALYLFGAANDVSNIVGCLPYPLAGDVPVVSWIIVTSLNSLQMLQNFTEYNIFYSDLLPNINHGQPP